MKTLGNTFILMAVLCTGLCRADTTADYTLRGSILRLEEVTTQKTADGESWVPLSGMEQTFDEAGNILTERWSGPSGRYTTDITFIYDGEGRLVLKSFIQEGGGVPDLTKYLRDEKGLVAEIRHTFTTGTYGWIYRCSYDDEGRLSEKEKYELSGKPLYTLRYLYDSVGRLSEERVYDPAGGCVSFTRHRYGEGEVIQELSPDGKNITSLRRTGYNEYGHPVTDVADLIRGGRVYTRTCEYTYDEKGNWITRREVFLETGTTLLTERTLVYNGKTETEEQE